MDSSPEKVKAEICFLASKQSFENVWDGKTLSPSEIKKSAQQAYEASKYANGDKDLAEMIKAVYVKAYEVTKDILARDWQVLSSMKFDYRFAGFESAYGHIRSDVLHQVQLTDESKVSSS